MTVTTARAPVLEDLRIRYGRNFEDLRIRYGLDELTIEYSPSSAVIKIIAKRRSGKNIARVSHLISEFEMVASVLSPDFMIHNAVAKCAEALAGGDR